MTREEASEELEQKVLTLRFLGGTHVNCVNGEALEMAIDALKKQIPQKPLTDITYEKFCPVCRYDVSECNYCWNCGQKIDWSEEGEE